ncbi:RNase E specificity factor CsrD, partial [Klebsiella pneumoniae]|nr:RNase E specificity factor CsrD [Klebsiella pneumoniae]
EIAQIDFMLNGNPLYSHSRPESYRPLGSHEQFRESTVQSLKHPGITLHLVDGDPMVNYFRSLSSTAPLSISIGFMVVII